MRPIYIIDALSVKNKSIGTPPKSLVYCIDCNFARELHPGCTSKIAYNMNQGTVGPCLVEGPCFRIDTLIISDYFCSHGALSLIMYSVKSQQTNIRDRQKTNPTGRGLILDNFAKSWVIFNNIFSKCLWSSILIVIRICHGWHFVRKTTCETN